MQQGEQTHCPSCNSPRNQVQVSKPGPNLGKWYGQCPNRCLGKNGRPIFLGWIGEQHSTSQSFPSTQSSSSAAYSSNYNIATPHPQTRQQLQSPQTFPMTTTPSSDAIVKGVFDSDLTVEMKKEFPL